ncbi:hypothetical protein K502DRAFT_326094 [Neoconidiobolus thromboides FSU 785]|nr:hypothetical protein K502DRAFT_326094 [Neoconidiobolus thromboides FSU 785]
MANSMNVDHHSEQFNFNAFANNIHSINSMKIDKPNNSSPAKRNHRPNDLNQKRFRDN